MDFYGRRLHSYKANLHTHSTLSDGEFPPQEVIRLYREHGYSVLAFTDHRKTNPVSGYDGSGLTLLSGIELHPNGPRGIRWHLLALGVPESFPGEFESGQQAADAVNAAGGIVFAAHPYWCGFTSAEVMTLSGVCGTEVYNTSTRYIGKAYNMQLWDEILDAGKRCTALAVDDMHRTSDLFRGWTMICAENNTPQALLAALKAGDFYASQGPEFHHLSYQDGIFEAEFTPCTEAILLTAQSRGYCGRVPDSPRHRNHLAPGRPARPSAAALSALSAPRPGRQLCLEHAPVFHEQVRLIGFSQPDCRFAYDPAYQLLSFAPPVPTHFPPPCFQQLHRSARVVFEHIRMVAEITQSPT